MFRLKNFLFLLFSISPLSLRELQINLHNFSFQYEKVSFTDTKISSIDFSRLIYWLKTKQISTLGSFSTKLRVKKHYMSLYWYTGRGFFLIFYFHNILPFLEEYSLGNTDQASLIFSWTFKASITLFFGLQLTFVQNIG